MYRYRHLIAVIIIVIVIIVIDIISDKYSDNKLNSINSSLDVIDSAIVGSEDENISDSQMEKIQKVSEDLVSEWRKSQELLACYIEHDELEKIGNKLYVLNSQIKSQNFVDAKQAIEEIRFLIEHLLDKQKVTIPNIF
jgi:hypothetical protein